jgi:hypothetical protein
MDRRTSRSETDLMWLEAAAAAVAAAAEEQGFEAGAATVPASLARRAGLPPHAPAVLRSTSLLPPASGSHGGERAAPPGRAQLRGRQQSLPVLRATLASAAAASPVKPALKRGDSSGLPRSNDSEGEDARSEAADTVMSSASMLSVGGGSGSTRRVSFAGGSSEPLSPVDSLASPRRRLPQLRRQQSLPERTAAAAAAAGGGTQHDWPDSTPMGEAGGSAFSRPLLTGRSLSKVSASSSLGGGGSGGSLRGAAPQTPRSSDEAQIGPSRRRAPGVLMGSPDTKWMTVSRLPACLAAHAC